VLIHDRVMSYNLETMTDLLIKEELITSVEAETGPLL